MKTKLKPSILYSWGRALKSNSFVHPLKQNRVSKNSLAIGASLSYGDCCLNDGGNIYHFSSKKIINFDKSLGVIKCEAGIKISELHNLVIPNGWMMPVSPGCENITLGGAVANDVHGKNYHISSSFSHHIVSFKLLRSDGKKYICSENKNLELFKATIGGVGLTGVILEVEFRLKKIETILTDTHVKTFKSIKDYLNIVDKYDQKYEFSAAWVDLSSSTKGRGVMFGSNFSKKKYLPKTYRKKVFFNFPHLNINFINRVTSAFFSKIYFWRYQLTNNSKIQNTIFDVLYPLDAIGNWNLMYGKDGFYQIQLSCPKPNFNNLFYEISNEILKKSCSALSVIKTFNNHNSIGMLSFPIAGHVTIAVDIPNKNIDKQFFNNIELIVKKHNGRFYLAKDAFMSKKFFHHSYPQSSNFLKFKDSNLTSSMFKRLF